MKTSNQIARYTPTVVKGGRRKATNYVPTAVMGGRIKTASEQYYYVLLREPSGSSRKELVG